MRTRLVFLALFSLLLLAGCRPALETPEAARDAAIAFLSARQQGSASGMHSRLTPRAARALPQSRIASYLRSETFSFGEVGTAVPADGGWWRVPVKDVVREYQGVQTRYPEIMLSLRYEQERWVFGWAEPLMEEAMAAFDANEHVQQQELARLIIELDPYHYRGYLELHFAYRGQQDMRSAERWIQEALRHTLPWQQPDVHDAMARFQLGMGQGSTAVRHAETALRLAAPYIPETYSHRWQADTAVVAARAYRMTGNQERLQEMIALAERVDPQNSSLLLLHYELRQR